jgi:hypothetical protein
MFNREKFFRDFESLPERLKSREKFPSEFIAVVKSFINHSECSFAIAKSSNLGMVVFQLCPEVWVDYPRLPRKGDLVLVKQLQLRDHGLFWEAFYARFLKNGAKSDP